MPIASKVYFLPSFRYCVTLSQPAWAASKVYFLTTVRPSSQVSVLCNPFTEAATGRLGQQLVVRLCEENRLDGGFSSELLF